MSARKDRERECQCRSSVVIVGSKVRSVGLHTVLLLQLKVLLVQGVDSVNHALDQLNLRVAETMLVGDVISEASLATRLSPGASGLDSQLLAPLLQGGQTLLGPAG